MIIRNETRGGNEKGGSVQLAFILRSRQLSQALRTGVFFTALVGLGFMVAYLRVEFFFVWSGENNGGGEQKGSPYN